MEFRVKDLWKILGDVPVNDDGEIEIPFLHFPEGTDREEIWHWFENVFGVIVYELMYNTTGEK